MNAHVENVQSVSFYCCAFRMLSKVHRNAWKFIGNKDGSESFETDRIAFIAFIRINRNGTRHVYHVGVAALSVGIHD